VPTRRMSLGEKTATKRTQKCAKRDKSEQEKEASAEFIIAKEFGDSLAEAGEANEK